MKLHLAMLAAGTLAFAPMTAQAGVVEELRVGLTQHNICVLDCDNADKEDGPNVSAELVFATPDFLDWALSPRPFLVGSINTAGKTSFGGAGLQWSFDLTETISIEPGIAYVIHDGATSNPFPDGDPRALTFSNENVLLGSEDLFRTSLALTWHVNDQWGAQIMYEHLSHGQILGDGRNQGMDNLGLRLTYKFGG